VFELMLRDIIFILCLYAWKKVRDALK